MKKIFNRITAFYTIFYIEIPLKEIIFYRKTHCLHNTKYHENNAF